MLWAGATSKDTWNDAAFRVYNSGHVDMGDVSISSSGGGGEVTIGDGKINVLGNGGKMTAITSAQMGSLVKAINNAGGGGATVALKTTSEKLKGSVTGKAFSRGGNVSHTITESDSVGRTLTITSTAPFSGTMSITTKYGQTGSPKIGYNTAKRNQCYVYAGTTYNGSLALFTMTATPRGSSSISGVYENGTAISASNGVYKIQRGKKYTVTVQMSISVDFTVKPDNQYGGTINAWQCFCDYSSDGTFASADITCALTSTEYVNNYYADGFMLFQGTTRYAGMTSADATVMQMRSGGCLLKFTADGLMQSLNGGSTFYRANPLVCAFKLIYNSASSTGYGYSWIFNPKGMNIANVRREAAGNILISHAFGLGTSYYPQGAYVCTGNTEYARTLMFDNINSTSLRVHIMTGNSHYDPQNTGGVDYCLIYIFDFKPY